MGRSGPSVVESSKQNDALTSDGKVHAARPAGLGGIGIGEQVYSMLLLSFFFLEIYAPGFIPYVGKALNFLLLSWIYAYYCFENGTFPNGVWRKGWTSLKLIGHSLLALFVLSATGTDAEQVVSTQGRKWSGLELGRLPVFYAVGTLLMRVLSLIALESREQLQDNKTLTNSGLCSHNFLTV